VKRLFVTAVVLASASYAKADVLPGQTGALCYFESTDDGTHLWLVDWKVDGKDYGIIASDRSWASNVLAYARETRGANKEVMYSSLRDIGVIALLENGTTLHQGTVRKRWELSDWSSGSSQTVHYVEVAAPPGSRTAANVVDAYVKGEGATKNSEGGFGTEVEKAINSACGGKVSVRGGEAAKAGLSDRARATAPAIAKLCADADYKTAVSRISELRFSASGKADTQVSAKGLIIEVALGSSPVNTPATVALWLKNNL